MAWMRFAAAWAVVGAALGGCGGEGSSLSHYLATASVGDFLKVSIDHSAKTITYHNLTNGQQGTVSYTVNADGSLQINDPAGNLVTGFEVPNYSLLLEVNHAGPNQNTHCMAFAVQQATIDQATMKQKSYNFMQFRTNSGGLEIGGAWFSGNNLTTTNFWPYGNMNGSGAFDTGSMDSSQWVLDPTGMFLTVDEGGGDVSTIFATPSGVLAVDTPNGNILCLEQAASKNFDPANAGTYKALVYFKENAQTNMGVETGTVHVDRGTMVISSTGHLTVTNEQGTPIVDTDLLPVADQAHLVGPGKLSNNCNGLFTFRVDNGAGEFIDVFVTFVQGAMFFCSFQPHAADSLYDYLQGIGMKQ